ncbi:MAG: hypothetical protein L0Z53_00205 [Acidobacteriales bacterium]|nr:hypothetical protein [Terriglobales bacterium]
MRDEDLIAGIDVKLPSAVPFIEGVLLPKDSDERYSANSPVQAASIDLHIGNIYLPGESETDVGGVKNPKADHVLETGETAVVTTQETINFPSNIAGFGFPPSRVSFRGLLMTNPGHVDPGYRGVLRFTVINMAKEAYALRRGDPIVTLLLFKMEADAKSGWGQRNTKGSGPPNQASINRLSRDFVDVEKRAKVQGVKVSAFITGALAVVAVLLQALTSGHLFYRDDIEDLKKRQEIVEYDVKSRVNIEQKLHDFENRLKDLERARAAIAAEPGAKIEEKTTKPPGSPR